MSKDKRGKNGVVVKLHPYQGGKMSTIEFAALPMCPHSRRTVQNTLSRGGTLDGIMKKIKLSKRRSIYKPYEFDTDQAKAIMSTPINPKYQSAHYMQVSYIGSGEQTPTALSSNGWMGRP